MWYSRHKYGAERTELNGRSYPSKKQARHAQELDLAKRAGELVFYLEEVPIQLPGCVHRIDFVEFWSDGEIRWVEVKGFDTPVGKLKRKQVESLYPFKITVI